MHNLFYQIFHYIDFFDENYINKISKNVNLIYRNYNIKYNIKELKKIRLLTKKRGIKIFLANDKNLAYKLKFDGVYLPSFNKSKILKSNIRKNFLIIGSAHNISEIKVKENQNLDYLFLSPLFNTKNKEGIGIIKFNNLSKNSNTKIIALGGINKNNLSKLRLLNINGFASISFIKEQYGLK